VLKEKAVIGVIWSFFEQLLRRGVSILVTLLLARFLVPEDFGLLAIVTVFITIATSLMESGIKEAVIRKLDADNDYFSTAFYTNLMLASLAYGLLFVAAPYIASFYEDTRLTLLLRVAGVVVLINAFQSIQIALLSRDLNFKLQMKAMVPAAIVSGLVAVVLAYQGAGVWALITQTLLNALLIVAVYWWIQSWRPLRVFDVEALKEMYGFGYKLFLSNLLKHISKNLYVLVIAKLFSAQVAGQYFFADRIKSMVVDQLVTSIQKVTYPALSTLQNDNIRLKANYRKVLQTTTFLLFPVVLMLAALSEPLFQVLFPPRWLPAALYLQLMCLVVILYPLHSINMNILKVKGRSDLFLGITLFKNITMLSILFVSYRYGVVGILVGKLVQSFIAYLPNGFYSYRLIGYSYKEQLFDVLPSLGLSLFVSSSVLALVTWLPVPPLALLVFGSILGWVLYLGLAKVLQLSPMIMAQGIIMKKIGKKPVHLNVP
jgi:O-antigen/teichoic acid export membrane protein